MDMGLDALSSHLDSAAKQHNLDGHRIQSGLGYLGETSAKISQRVKNSVHEMAESEKGRAVRSTLERTSSRVGERLEEVKERVAGSGNNNSNADDLKSLRRRMEHDKAVLDAEAMSKEAEEACMNVITVHLEGFIQNNPEGTYEGWLRELHPENHHEGSLLSGYIELDHRFYVKDNGHMNLWNARVDKDSGGGKRKRVDPRYGGGIHEEDSNENVVDLLDMSAGFTDQPPPQNKPMNDFANDQEIDFLG
eukprot:CAMPEP_0195540160 /NCGR_PEP_ID=MMETSP0794_2-20130614/50430_1 /TAXON_ID=515487 /ORGANISM="Stephanopyxis turris, Strain CCMP 815" /LENGTH=248 /DNA_ID=CAMNT_0040674225 /DNA_START=183 /DNA_END=929 /DNA_ORIENTATION=+